MADLSLVEIVKDSSARKWGGKTRRERFYANCTLSASGCLHHGGWKDKDGYPMVTFVVAGKKVGRRASHVSLALNGVDVPGNEQVNHHCDNRLCVEPSHLFIGSQSDNISDMMSKGRHAHGDQHKISKLTTEAVLDIRENCKERGAPRLFAAKYGVSVSTIYAVRCGQNWNHVS